jgi:hypothetical protein
MNLFAIFLILMNSAFNSTFLCSAVPVVQRPVDIKNRPRIPIPDEDPYSEAGNSASSSGSSGSGSGSGGSAGEGVGRDRVAATREQLLIQSQQFGTRRSEKPPKLPPRDNNYHNDMPKVSAACDFFSLIS